ncbi:methyltransferase domain-containing protein, partial [Halorubrum sp. SP3]
VSQARSRLDDQATVSNEDGLSHLEDCEDGAYDFILMHAVIEHLEKEYVEQLLNTARRKLTDDGVISILTGNLANPLSNSIMFGDFDHKFGYTPAGLSTLLENHDYEIAAVSGFEHAKYSGTVRYFAGQAMEAVPRLILRLGYVMLRLRRPATLAPLMFVVATPVVTE